MRYYPVYLDIQNRKCLVVGGGSVGTRKVMTLMDCGASVTVVSLDFTTQLFQLADTRAIKLKKRPYRSSDLDGMFLVIGATNNEELNRQISEDAQRLNKLCNIADRPEACNFILPSFINRGDLIIAVSTSGKSPALAKKLRKDLENEFGQEYAEFLRLMEVIRQRLLSKNRDSKAHKYLFEQLISRGLIEMIKNQKEEEINSLLFEILGNGFEFEALMKTSDIVK